jgi:hypothetical protein
VTDFILEISSYDGIVPGAKHYRGRVKGEHPRSCHGGSTFHGGGPPELRGKTTCAEGHVLPGRVEWEVEAIWTEDRYQRYAAREFEGDGPSTFASEQEVVDAARARFLAAGDEPSWWEDKWEPGKPGDKLYAGWIPRPQDSSMVEENWGTVIAEVPADGRVTDAER